MTNYFDLPQCQSYKEVYDKCYKEKIGSKLSKYIFDPSNANACDEPFQVYI
jgi:hypothetical protein